MIGYNVKVINIMEKYNIKVIKWWRKEVIDILVEDWVEGVDAESLLDIKKLFLYYPCPL